MTKRLFTTLLFVFYFTTAYATVTTVRYFRLGEADGVVVGDLATNSVDSAGGSNLVFYGSAIYSADVTTNFNSTLSLFFNGTQSGGGTTDTNNFTTNFGFEVWVKPSSVGYTRYIAFSGNPGAGGWGFLQSGTGFYSAFLGGQTLLGSATVNVGEWTHLAFVCQTNSATFYVNGIANATTNLLPNPHDPFITVVPGGNSANDSFEGNLDEVRLFKFTTGAFSTNDLLIGIHAPTLGVSSVSSNAFFTWPMAYSNYGLQFTTNLTSGNWTSIYGPVPTNGAYSLTQSVTNYNAGFYRLISPCGVAGVAPQLLPGQYVRVTRNGVVSDITSETQTVSVANSAPSASTVFDATSYIDPAFCNSGTNDLDFHWVLTQEGEIITDVGINGYDTPILTINLNSAVQSNQGSLSVTVTSKRAPFLSTSFVFPLTITKSTLTINIFNNCQADPTYCPTCPCSVANALPTSEPD